MSAEMNYKAYLESPQWRKIRRRVLRRDRGRCRSCGGRASQVHHGSYDPKTMRGDSLGSLYAICGRCHEAVSLDIFGIKRDRADQAAWTKALDEPRPPRPPKPPRERKRRMTLEEIRASSLEYAEGRRK